MLFNYECPMYKSNSIFVLEHCGYYCWPCLMRDTETKRYVKFEGQLQAQIRWDSDQK